jgi:hypothetical protein
MDSMVKKHDAVPKELLSKEFLSQFYVEAIRGSQPIKYIITRH